MLLGKIYSKPTLLAYITLGFWAYLEPLEVKKPQIAAFYEIWL